VLHLQRGSQTPAVPPAPQCRIQHAPRWIVVANQRFGTERGWLPRLSLCEDEKPGCLRKPTHGLQTFSRFIAFRRVGLAPRLPHTHACREGPQEGDKCPSPGQSLAAKGWHAFHLPGARSRRVAFSVSYRPFASGVCIIAPIGSRVGTVGAKRVWNERSPQSRSCDFAAGSLP
jgi:hypothetical protein